MTPDQQKLRNKCLFRLIVCGDTIVCQKGGSLTMLGDRGNFDLLIEEAAIPVDDAWKFLHEIHAGEGEIIFNFADGPLTEQLFNE